MISAIGNRRQHNAYSLVELLVVFGIISVAIGITLGVISRIRLAALQAQSANNYRQIGLAVQNYCSDHGGKLPAEYNDTFPGCGPMFSLLPYIEQGNYYAQVVNANGSVGNNAVVKPYINPMDPTITEEFSTGLSSYGMNAMMLRKRGTITQIIPDGTSNTIMFAEHYAHNCGGAEYSWFTADVITYYNPVLHITVTVRRATFSDLGDVTPVTAGNPPTTTPSRPDQTFQVHPNINVCNPTIPQTPQSSGMLVLLADGSVRNIASGIAATTFWSAVTPAGGETLGEDW